MNVCQSMTTDSPLVLRCMSFLDCRLPGRESTLSNSLEVDWLRAAMNTMRELGKVSSTLVRLIKAKSDVLDPIEQEMS